MKRAIVLVSFALLAAAAALRAGAAPMAAGLQYEELDRVYLAGTPPPPPGSFAAQAAAIESPGPDQGKKKHGLLNALVSPLLDPNGDPLGAWAFTGFTQGRVERYSYYNGWERIDDVVGKSATIRKCDLHELIELDLDKKTYRTIDTAARPASVPSPAPSAHRAPGEQAPGTAEVEVSSSLRTLEVATIDGMPAQHVVSSNVVALTQATGSCKNGTYDVVEDAYLSGFAQPHAICPLDFRSGDGVPRRPEQMVARGGCRGTAPARSSGSPGPVDKLALYSLMTLSAPAARSSPQAGGIPAAFSFLTERGNVRVLSSVDRTLFEVPSDYTKVP